MRKKIPHLGSFLLLLSALGLMNSALQGQTIIRNFSGLNLNDVFSLGAGGGTPPDSMGAAGPDQFVEFINGAFAIYNKSGTRQLLISDRNFWLNAGISAATVSAGASDPRILYDAGSGRWFATEITVQSTSNQVLVARSDTSDPGGGWKAVHFTGNASFADYDTLGVDAAGVYISVNNFDVFDNFTGVSLFSIPKADLTNATPTLANLTAFENINDQIYGFTLQGVTNPDPGPGHGVIIAIDNAAFKFFDRTTINGAGTAGATLSPTVRISTTYDAGPHPATQPSGQTVDALDDRFSGSVRQVGTNLFMANTILEAGRDAVHWLVLDETSNTLLGEGIISDPGFDFFQPSIAANHNGKILLTFNRSGPTSPGGNISIYAALGNVSGGGVTMGLPFLLKQGTVDNFTISFDSAPYRWGDYSATMVDPTDDDLFWCIQEIPFSSTGWGTQITLLSVNPNTPSLTITPAGTNMLLTWPASTDPAYLLETTTALQPPAIWTPVANPVAISFNQNVVTTPKTAGANFYRLKK